MHSEDKQHKVPMGYAQNIAQLESSFETNKKKRKASKAFDGNDFDYLYNIVTTGWQRISIVFFNDYVT